MVSSITFTLSFAAFIDLNCKSVPTFSLKIPTPEPILLAVSITLFPSIKIFPFTSTSPSIFIEPLPYIFGSVEAMILTSPSNKVVSLLFDIFN